MAGFCSRPLTPTLLDSVRTVTLDLERCCGSPARLRGRALLLHQCHLPPHPPPLQGRARAAPAQAHSPDGQGASCLNPRAQLRYHREKGINFMTGEDNYQPDPQQNSARGIFGDTDNLISCGVCTAPSAVSAEDETARTSATAVPYPYEEGAPEVRVQGQKTPKSNLHDDCFVTETEVPFDVLLGKTKTVRDKKRLARSLGGGDVRLQGWGL